MRTTSETVPNLQKFCTTLAGGRLTIDIRFNVHQLTYMTDPRCNRVSNQWRSVSGKYRLGQNMIFSLPTPSVIITGLACVNGARGMVFLRPLIVFDFKKRQTLINVLLPWSVA
ncbi:hypothetical protein AVEN_165578-1 [Araneus ventricosus]|uniref:Uncharacterized protein n=1 Tax=Araneus ventricosus TaxID=182803 RepID=A0A4Y2EL57_ARAVE|nr:hypothetical protein AVEN_165578-1 [Araneus ventricosus]